MAVFPLIIALEESSIRHETMVILVIQLMLDDDVFQSQRRNMLLKTSSNHILAKYETK